jgi:hypothetical protein
MNIPTITNAQQRLASPQLAVSIPSVDNMNNSHDPISPTAADPVIGTNPVDKKGLRVLLSVEKPTSQFISGFVPCTSMRRTTKSDGSGSRVLSQTDEIALRLNADHTLSAAAPRTAKGEDHGPNYAELTSVSSLLPRVDPANAPRVAESASQLNDIHEWLNKNNHLWKLDLLPATTDYRFSEPPSIIGTDSGPKRLLLGSSSSKEIWASLSTVSSRQINIVEVEIGTGRETSLNSFPTDDITLEYPFEPLQQNGSTYAWSNLKTLIGYIFLRCGVVDRLPIAGLVDKGQVGRLPKFVTALNYVLNSVDDRKSKLSSLSC